MPEDKTPQPTQPPAPEPLVQPPIATPDTPRPEDLLDEPLLDIEDVPEYLEDEDDDEEKHICENCFFFGGLHKKPQLGLCLGRSIKLKIMSNKKEKLLWVRANKDATKCKFWYSKVDSNWEEFWSFVGEELTVEQLSEFIGNLEKLLEERIVTDTGEDPEDLEDIDDIDGLDDIAELAGVDDLDDDGDGVNWLEET